MVGVLILVFVVVSPLRVFGAEWSKPVLPCSAGARLERSTWSESGSTASGKLTVFCNTSCVNTGSTAFTVYDADASGTQLGEYMGPILAGVTTSSCSPDSSTQTCHKVELVPGDYVFVPDATGASAVCTSWQD